MATLQGNSGQTGKQVGQFLTVGFGETSDVMVTELQARYYENTYRGQKFSAMFTAAALAAAAAASSFVLVNPVSSGKNLVLIDALIAAQIVTVETTTSTDVMLGAVLAGALGTVGTAVVINGCLISGSSGSVAKAYATATLNGVPVNIRRLAAFSAQVSAASIHDDIAGAVIVPPGYAIALYAVMGTPADVSIGPVLTWDEVAI